MRASLSRCTFPDVTARRAYVRHMGRGSGQDHATASMTSDDVRAALRPARAPVRRRPDWHAGDENPFAVDVARREIASLTQRAFSIAYEPALPDLAIPLDDVVWHGRTIWRLRDIHGPNPIAQHGPVRSLQLVACRPLRPGDGDPQPPRLCVIERERHDLDDDWVSTKVLADSDHDIDSLIDVLNARAAELDEAGAVESYREGGNLWWPQPLVTTREKIDAGLDYLERYGGM